MVSTPRHNKNTEIIASPGAQNGVKKLLLTVPVHKPKPQDFVRVHPDPAFRADFPMIELGLYRHSQPCRRIGCRDHPDVAVHRREPAGHLLFLARPHLQIPTESNGSGAVPARGRRYRGRQVGIRVKANMSLGAYEVSYAESAMVEPMWPEASFHRLFAIVLSSVPYRMTRLRCRRVGRDWPPRRGSMDPRLLPSRWGSLWAHFAARAGGVAAVMMMSGLSFRELCGQCIERFSPSISILDLEICPSNSEITQRPKQHISQMCDGGGRKVTEAINSRALLCPRSERPSGNSA